MDDLRWLSPTRPPFVLEGFPFIEQEGVYRRMTLNPPRPIPESVESLAWCTAGGMIRFRATLKTLKLRVKLRGTHSFDHLTATGQCGFDCYLAPEGTPRYYSTARFDRSADQYETSLVELPEPRNLEVLLHFPLYQGVYEVLLGLDAGAELSAPAPRAIPERVVIYGTSITQGGCATRPGMAYSNILARRLNVQVVNLGFSGSGRCEPEMAYALREMENMALFVLDTEANVTEFEDMRERYPEFLRIFREKQPETPVLVVSKVPYAKELIHEDMLNKRLQMKEFQRELTARLRAGGDQNIHFFDGESLYGGCFEEYAVDGVHATDLGFLHMAEGLEPVLRELVHLP